MRPQEARGKASRLSRKTSKEYFVIWSPEEWDDDQNHYQVCREEDLFTFYTGINNEEILAIYKNGKQIDP